MDEKVISRKLREMRGAGVTARGSSTPTAAPERNEKGQILGCSGNPIPHLYGAGEFGSIWSDMHNGGGNLSECLAFGRARDAQGCLGIA